MEALPICGYCGRDVDDKQARIRALCSLDTCGETLYHPWCAESFTNMCKKHGLMKALMKTSSTQKQKVASKAKPWKNLEMCFKCPAGWYKQDHDALRGLSKDQLAAAQRAPGAARIKPLCTGRVVSVDLVEVAPTRPKKGKFRGGQAQPAPRAAPPGAAGAPPASGAPGGAPAEPKAIMSLAAAKEFLGISSDDDEDDGYTTYNNGGGSGGGGGRADPLAALSRLSHAATESDAGTSTFINDSVGGGAAAAAGRPSPAPSSPSPSVAAAGEPPPELTREEVEVAVREGLLPQTYRVRFCPGAFPGGALNSPAGGVCGLVPACVDAHSLEELRLGAAIAAGTVPADFKTLLCQETADGGGCPAADATCAYAHRPQDLRVPEAVALGRLDACYKTQICTEWVATGGGECRTGLRCPHAHGPRELRREASVALGVHAPDFKASICAFYGAGHCVNGFACAAAHGAGDLRLASLRATGEVDATYKTALCEDYEAMPGACRAGEWCTRAHGAAEVLPEVDPGATLCPLAEELGVCPLEQGACWFAHSVDELKPGAERWEAIERFAAAFAAGAPPPPPGSPPHGPASFLSAASSAASTPVAASPARARKLPFDYEQYKKAAAAKKGGDRGGGRRAGRAAAPAPEGAGGGGGGGGGGGRAKGGRHGPPRPSFSGRRRPNELRLCPNLRDMGRCPVVNCEYAHGDEELRCREAAWVAREREQEAARRAAEAEAHRAAAEAEEERRAAEAAVMESMGFEGAAEAVQESLITAAAAAGGAAVTSTGRKDPRVEAAWGQISQAALGLLRTHKLDHCALRLMELGFEGEVPAAAAAAAGADFDDAVNAALEAAGAPHKLQMRRQAEVDVAAELEGLLSFAFDRGLTAGDVDVEVSIAGGDWERARAALAVRHFAAAQAAAGVGAAVAESKAAAASWARAAATPPKRSPRGLSKALKRSGSGGKAADVPPLAPLPLPAAAVVTAPVPVLAVASVDVTMEDEAAGGTPVDPGLPPLPRSLEVSSLAAEAPWGGGGGGPAMEPPLPSPALLGGQLGVETAVDSVLLGARGAGEPAAAAAETAPAPAPDEEEDLDELLGLLGVGA